MSCCFLLCLRPLEKEPRVLPACSREELTSMKEAVQLGGKLGNQGRSAKSSRGTELRV